MNRNLYRSAGLAMLALSLTSTGLPLAQAAASTITLPPVTHVDNGHPSPDFPYNTGYVPAMPTAGEPGSRIPLSGRNDNTRDLAGYRTADGKWQIQPHRLIRSAHLGSLSPADVQTLSHDYDVRAVVDFRTPGQTKGKPDVAIPGTTMTQLSVLGPHAYVDAGGWGDGEFYKQRLAFGYAAVTGYRQFLNQLLTQPGATLYHCSSGKDRTGIATVLIMSALGMDEATIIKDYMLSQTYHHHVDYQWIKEYFKEVKQNYGSMTKYLDQLIGFDATKREQLRAQYLVSTDGHQTPYPGATTTKPQSTQHHKIKILTIKQLKQFLVRLKPHQVWFHELHQAQPSGRTKVSLTKWHAVREAQVDEDGQTVTYVQVQNRHGDHRWIRTTSITHA